MDDQIEKLKKLGINFYRAEESESSKYIMIPKQLYICPFYKKYLTPTSRELYAWLVDRMSLSKKTTSEGDVSYVDENGYIYLIFTREEVMEILNISKQTAVDSFKILSTLGLIYEKRLGQGKANRIYIGKIKYMNEKEAKKMIEIVENEGIIQKSKNQTSKNQTSKSLKSELPEVEELDPTNTDVTNTDITETDTSSSSNDFSGIYKFFEENICELKRTTFEKFKKIIEVNNLEFIKSVIEECALSNVQSFKGFEVAFKSYIDRDCKTAADVINAAKKYRDAKKNKAVEKRSQNNKSKQLRFADYQQREYDYDSLEKKLLGWEDN